MNFLVKKSVLILPILLLANPSRADETISDLNSAKQSTVATAPESAAIADQIHLGWSLFGGLGVGYSNESTQFSTGKLDGSHLEASLLGSYRWQDWILDAGLGFFRSSVSGPLNISQKYKVETRAAFAEISPSYVLTGRWHVGPVLNYAFGTDLSFKRGVGPRSSALLTGLQLVYEIPNSATVRILLRAMSDINVKQATYSYGLLGVQFGLPFGDERFTQPSQNAPVAQDLTAPTVESLDLLARKAEQDVLPMTQAGPIQLDAPKDRRLNANDVMIGLDPQLIGFKTNKSNLSVNSQNILKKIGAYLAANGGGWTSLEVSGHADQRGQYTKNMQLSKRRSAAVAKSLIAGGLDASQLKTTAYSSSKPLDWGTDEKAWAKNRRAELIFRGVKSPNELERQLVQFGSGDFQSSADNVPVTKRSRKKIQTKD